MIGRTDLVLSICEGLTSHITASQCDSCDDITHLLYLYWVTEAVHFSTVSFRQAIDLPRLSHVYCVGVDIRYTSHRGHTAHNNSISLINFNKSFLTLCPKPQSVFIYLDLTSWYFRTSPTKLFFLRFFQKFLNLFSLNYLLLSY